MSRSLATPGSKSNSARSLASALVAAVMPDFYSKSAGMCTYFHVEWHAAPYVDQYNIVVFCDTFYSLEARSVCSPHMI